MKISKLKIGAAALIVLAAAGGTYAVWAKTANSPACSEDELAKAALVLDSSKEDLKNVVEKFKSKSKFEKDANCLNVATTYYVNAGDSVNARLYFDKLSLVYDPQKGFSKLLRFGKDFESLKASVDFLSNVEEANNNNQIIAPNIESGQPGIEVFIPPSNSIDTGTPP